MVVDNKSRQDELLTLNKQQAEFYDTPHAQRQLNFIMGMWLFFRRRMYYLMENSGIRSDVYVWHKEWMGDLSGKKVLDFGCFQGNALTDYLATNSASYLGVDLSKEALNSLAAHFERKGIKGARLQCVDVLSEEFTESGFDIIYAQGVLHHFKPIDVILHVLGDKLAPGGRIISLDPLQTSILTRSVRAIYHPFRSDKEWEWPFTRKTFDTIRKYFKIVKVQGIIGYSKWAIPFTFFHKKLAVNIANYLHGKDIACASNEGGSLWGCMQVAMCLERKDDR